MRVWNRGIHTTEKREGRYRYRSGAPNGKRAQRVIVKDGQKKKNDIQDESSSSSRARLLAHPHDPVLGDGRSGRGLQLPLSGVLRRRAGPLGARQDGQGVESGDWDGLFNGGGGVERI